jgi:hypothetical protein
MVFALILLFLFQSGLYAQTASPSASVPVLSSREYTSAASSGYIITITNRKWVRNYLSAVDLSINFTIKHANGTPVTFVVPARVVEVSSWTDTYFAADNNHTQDAYFDPQHQEWQADLVGVDPRNKTVHIDFEIRDPVMTAAWKAAQMDIPIVDITAPEASSIFVPIGQTSQGEVKYQIDAIGSQLDDRSNYAIWTRSTDPTQTCRVIGVQERFPLKVKNGTVTLDNSEWQHLYWRADSSPVAQGEYGTVYDYWSSDITAFPMYVSTQLSSHDQQKITFSKVPVPGLNETLVIDQKPDKKTMFPIRLRAISYISSNRIPDRIRLTFDYNVADDSDVSLFTVAASDRQGNSLNHSYSDPQIPANRPTLVDRSLQTITVDIATPSAGPKTINLSFLLTKDTPIGSPTIFSIDSAGKWTVIDVSQLPVGEYAGNY